MTDPNPAATERHFLAWLGHQSADPDDLGHLARAHLEGIVDLTWGARAETPAIRASYAMAKEHFSREVAAGLVRQDGTRKPLGLTARAGSPRRSAGQQPRSRGPFPGRQA